LATETAPVAELQAIVSQLMTVKAYANDVQQRLYVQQSLEPEANIDIQLEMLGNFYKAIVESTQVATEQCVRALTTMKGLPMEVASRAATVSSLTPQ
jgi:hypothetical protein